MYKIMTVGPTQVRENVHMARSLEITNPDFLCRDQNAKMFFGNLLKRGRNCYFNSENGDADWISWFSTSKENPEVVANETQTLK